MQLVTELERDLQIASIIVKVNMNSLTIGSHEEFVVFYCCLWSNERCTDGSLFCLLHSIVQKRTGNI